MVTHNAEEYIIVIKTIKMELIIRREIQRWMRERDSLKEEMWKKKRGPDEVLLENRRIFMCFTAARTNRNRGRERKRNEGGITGNREKRVKNKTEGEWRVF